MSDSNNPKSGSFIQKIKNVFSKDSEKKDSNQEELKKVLEAFRNIAPKDEEKAIARPSTIKETIRKHTPFGVARSDGRNVEINYFDTRLIDILKRFKIIPLYASISETAVVGFYEINVNALKSSNFGTILVNDKNIHICTLIAPILREVDKEVMSEEDQVTVDTVCSLVEEALKK